MKRWEGVSSNTGCSVSPHIEGPLCGENASPSLVGECVYFYKHRFWRLARLWACEGEEGMKQYAANSCWGRNVERFYVSCFSPLQNCSHEWNENEREVDWVLNSFSILIWRCYQSRSVEIFKESSEPKKKRRAKKWTRVIFIPWLQIFAEINFFVWN